MITIEINEKTKAGKALIATAKILSEQNKGIVFVDDENDTALVAKMQHNRKNDLLSASEKKGFLDEIKKAAKR